MLSGVFILNTRGEQIISRIFRDEYTCRGVVDAFRLHVLNAKEVRSPIKTIGQTTLLHFRCEELYLLASSNQNVDCCLVLEILKKITEVLKSYFNNKLNEEAIRKNFVLVYELIDEMLDYGIPQNTSIEALKAYITQGKARKGSSDKLKEEQIKKITVNATGAGPCPWRADDIHYRRNQLFIDVVESVNLLFATSTGNILNSNVTGVIWMKSQLSGMPECKLGLNDKVLMANEEKSGSRKKRTNGVEIDDCTFHQCVKLGKFDADRTISFTPPDGTFELMKYRTSDNIQLPLKVFPTIKEVGRTRIEASVTVKSCYSPKLTANGLEISIPMPKNTAQCSIRASKGKAYYAPDKECILWRIKKFPGGAEASISAEVKLLESVTLDKTAWVRPPISLSFQVPMFTASGLHVRFLKVFEKSHYQTVKWVRYVTQAGHYQFKTNNQ